VKILASTNTIFDGKRTKHNILKQKLKLSWLRPASQNLRFHTIPWPEVHLLSLAKILDYADYKILWRIFLLLHLSDLPLP